MSKWTRDLPKVPGEYRWRWVFGERLVTVIAVLGGHPVSVGEPESHEDDDGTRPLIVWTNGEWLGPLA